MASLLVFAVIGFLAGPSLHHLGVRAAVRAPFDGLFTRCETCAQVRRTPFRRTCQACDAAIRRREPLIWIVSAVGFGGAAEVAGVGWLLPAHLFLVALTTVLVVTDLDQKIIPNRILYPGTLLAAALLAIGAGATGRLPDVGRGALAGFGYFGVLLIVAVATRGGFGMGDVKLAVVLGLFMGFWSWRVLASGLFYTGVLGGLPAIVMIVRGRARRGDELPYGPAMVFGTWTALFLGPAGPL
jgi:leader peptidase (prepilin peptidase)/N-methyltransferase